MWAHSLASLSDALERHPSLHIYLSVSWFTHFENLANNSCNLAHVRRCSVEMKITMTHVIQIIPPRHPHYIIMFKYVNMHIWLHLSYGYVIKYNSFRNSSSNT